jgi:hypothetical protein
MSKFYHVLALRQALNLNSTNLPNLSIIFPNFFHIILDVTQTTTSFNCRPPPMCAHPIDPIGIHPLHCAHDNECTRTHDVVHNTIGAITQDVNFRMGRKQLHAFPLTIFNSFHRQVNIVFIKNGIRILVNIVIVYPLCANLLP